MPKNALNVFIDLNTHTQSRVSHAADIKTL